MSKEHEGRASHDGVGPLILGEFGALLTKVNVHEYAIESTLGSFLVIPVGMESHMESRKCLAMLLGHIDELVFVVDSDGQGYAKPLPPRG